MPKDKKEKKRKHDEVEVDDAEPTTSLTTTTSSAKKEKKEKKEKKRKSAGTEAVDADGDTIVGDAVAVVKKDEDEDEDEGEDERKERLKKVVVPLAALVPFANPLCDERSVKKVLKGVKKGIIPPTQPFISLSTPSQPTNVLTRYLCNL